MRSAQTYYRRTIFIICTKYKYIRVLYSYCNFPCVYMYENVTFWTSELCFISDRECTSINVKQRRRNDIYFIQQTVIHSAKIYTKVKILGCKWLISVVFFHNSCQLVIILLNTQKKVSQGKWNISSVEVVQWVRGGNKVLVSFNIRQVLGYIWQRSGVFLRNIVTLCQMAILSGSTIHFSPVR